jgi:NAD+ diphosphatase
MLAFTAEYAGGDIRIYEREISEAHWFGPDNLPLLPKPGSIARQLIDWFLESQA